MAGYLTRHHIFSMRAYCRHDHKSTITAYNDAELIIGIIEQIQITVGMVNCDNDIHVLG